MTFSTIENQIKTDWSMVRAFIALHPWVYTAATLAGAWILGRLHIPH